MALKTWKIKEAERPIDAEMARKWSLTPLLCKCLEARNWTNDEQLEALFSGTTVFHDPFLFHDMQAAVARIRRAVQQHERITVYGDYDVDGVTSSYLLSTELTRQGATCDVYIPERNGEGYGLNAEAIGKIAERGTTLLITVDCGVTAVEEVRIAYERGMQVIITDHHEPSDVLPVCEALLNPKCADCGYPFAGLAGVGVALKLASALRGDGADSLDTYGDLVTLGTIADVVPLTDENRSIVSRGLESILYTTNKGLAALNRAAAFCDAAHSAEDVAFKLAPKMNAAGRMRSAHEAFKLLQSRTADEAESRAAYLSILNTERQDEEKRISQEAESMINPRRLTTSRAICLLGDTWKHGIIGISAAKLAERYHVPTVLFAPDGELIRGSARGVEGFDLFAAMNRAVEGLNGRCGGHTMAAGVTLPANAFDEFRRRFESICQHDPALSAETSVVWVDCEVQPEELTEESIASLARLEPFGAGNERPQLCLRNARIEEMIPIGGGKHLKMTVSAGGKRWNLLAFRQQRDRFPHRRGDVVDLVFTASLESYRGAATVKLILTDLQPCAAVREKEADAVQRFQTLKAGGMVTGTFPNRRTLGQIWRRLLELAPGGSLTPAQLAVGIQTGLTDIMDVLTAIEAFDEAGLIECISFDAINYQSDLFIRLCAEPHQKADLQATPIYARFAAGGGQA